MKTDDAVKINVGGTTFCSTIETFSKSPMLNTFLNNRKCENDIIFIDKSPKIFEYVLEILREDLSFGEVPTKYKRLVFRMIDYFLLKDFVGNPVYFAITDHTNLKPLRINSLSNGSSYNSFDIRKGQKILNVVFVFESIPRSFTYEILINNTKPFMHNEVGCVTNLKQTYPIFIEAIENFFLNVNIPLSRFSLEYIYLEIA